MNKPQRSYTMADAYQSMYLNEGLFSRNKSKSPAKAEELPSYKKLQTAIADRKKLGDFVNDNPWQANPADRKAISREEIDLESLVSYLIDQKCTDDEESAMIIIENMSEDWLEYIMEKMSEKELRQAAMDSVKKDVASKSGENSIISGKVTKAPKDRPKYNNKTDSEAEYKKTYGKNKSFWD